MKPGTALWTAEGEEKRAAVQRMFAEIAPTYDRLNAIMTLQMHSRWRRIAVNRLQLKEGETAMDICTGTGDFLVPLRNVVGRTGCVYGLDFCLPMMEIARGKPTNGLTLGDACALPLQSETVDAVTVGWGIRNVPDIDRAHAEIARVLRPGGRFVSIDMALPQQPLMRRLSQVVCQTLLPRLGALFGFQAAYTYLPKSVERFLSRKELAESMTRAGFVNVAWRDFMFGNVCLHYGTKK